MVSPRPSSTVVSLGEGVGVEVIDPLGAPLLPEGSALLRFPGDRPAALTLEVRRGQLPEIDPGGLAFECLDRWKVYRTERKHIVAMYASHATEPYSVAVVDFEAGRGELFVAAPPAQTAYPFFYPVDEIIFSKLLADRGGFICHACGFEYRGRGVLLVGHSGAGKSTLAELLAEQPELQVLSDDRVAVRVVGDRIEIAGTPWHGLSSFAAQRSAELALVLFLSHGDSNRQRTLPVGRAAARLLALSVLPGWDRPALEQTLAAGERVAATVPAAELAFVPDPSAVTYILELLTRTGAVTT